MTAKRSEPFLVALAELRRRLRTGALPPESRLGAAELAAELGLSPTPMREALARLVGEGLLEDRRGLGVFVRRLSVRDVADLYRLNQMHLEIALAAPAPAQPAPGARDASAADLASPVAAVDRLFAGWVAEANGALLLRAYLRAQLQLALVRHAEALHLGDLHQEHEWLRAAGDLPPRRRLPAVRTFFRRRLRLAERLAAALEPGPAASGTLLSNEFE
jgi:DNA-binding GntR family transcriptional regulator